MFRFMFVRSRGWQEILILVAAGITLGRTPVSHAAAGDQSGKPHHALLPDGNGALAGRSPAQRLDVRVADGVLDIVADGNELRLRLHEDGGIEQQVANLRVGIGYSVALRAPAPGVARVKVVASGTLRAKSEPFGDGIRFDDGAGVAVLRFGPLSARAGDARDIPARWDVHPDGTLVIELDVPEGAPAVTASALLTRAGPEPKPLRARPLPADEFGLLAPPANDTCAGAAVIPASGPFPHLSATYDITDATDDGDPPMPSCQVIVSRGTWFRFTPSVTADYTLSLCADGPTATTVEDTVLAVYTSSDDTCAGTMSEVAGYCDDDSCVLGEFQSALVEVRLEAGRTYFILAYQFDTVPPPAGLSAVQLLVDKAPPPPNPPPNDTCPGAEIVPASGPFPYLSSMTRDISGATMTGDPLPSCFTGASRGTWYRFTPSETATYRVSTCADAGTGTTVDDTVLAVFSSSAGCAGPFLPVVGGCDTDGCALEPLQASVAAVPLDAGRTYYILAYKAGPTAPSQGNTAVQLLFDRNPPGPPNDFCTGAETIPGVGPFPYLTPVVDDVTNATSTGDPAPPSCQAQVSRSLWYAFTPVAPGTYAFSVCADAPTSTTVDDTVLVVYRSNDGTCSSAITQVPGACDDDGCSSETNQSAIRQVQLDAGVTYYVLAHQYGSAPPAPGSTALQLRVERSARPPNDGCAAAAPLALDVPLTGQTLLAANDYRLSGSACFTPLGATSTAPGNDVVFSYRATTAGPYSFRVTGYATSLDPVVYVARDCPQAAPPATVSDCIKAVNRTTSSGSEEVDCVQIAAGERVFVYVDEHAVSAGSTFTIEANRCVAESEPNGTTATAGPLACAVTGGLPVTADWDFFDLSSPAAGGRVFAVADGVAANAADFDLRVTSAADTLEYDDANNDIVLGGLSPNVAGTRTPGGAAYLKVSHYSPSTRSEPYRLHHIVRPPAAEAITESEPNDTPAQANAAGTGYVSGALSTSADADLFAFDANAGDLLYLALDLDPQRDNTPFNGTLALLDATGATIVGVNDPGGTSQTAPGTGSLDATTPASPAEAVVYRVRASGRYHARVGWFAGSPGDYLLSIAAVCRVTDTDGDGVQDGDDCAPQDPDTWSLPEPAQKLGFPGAPGDHDALAWTAPAAPGGRSARYDVLRAASPSGFGSAACVATNVAGTSSVDDTTPAPGVALHYLVRSENACGGNLGADSGGAPRSGAPCP